MIAGLITALLRPVALPLGRFRGWISLRKRRREAGKCDNLSFLRVCLL